MSKSVDTGLRLGWFISTGNEADLNLAQVLRYLVERPEVGVLLVFSETLRDPEVFIEAVQRARQLDKPVVLLKAGRSEEAAKAAMSHTASIVGSAAVLDAVCRQYGVLVAETMEEMLDFGMIFQDGRRALGPRTAIITTSGGAGVLLADEAAAAGLAVPVLPPSEQEVLHALMPTPFYGNLTNPVDTTAQVVATPGAMTALYGQLATSPSIDLMATIAWATSPDAMIQEIVGCYRSSNRPVAVFATARVPALQAAGVPTYTDPRRLMRAFAALVRVSARASGDDVALPLAEPVRAAQARDCLASFGGRGVLMEHESKQLLAIYGVPVTRELLAQNAAEAVDAAQHIGGRVVIKVMSHDLPHKSDVGAIRIGLQGAREIGDAYVDMLEEVGRNAPHAPIAGVLVQEMVPARMELVCGLQRDPVFGPVVAVGMGGVLIEQIAETVLLRPPFDDEAALGAIRSLLGGRLVHGTRGLSQEEQSKVAAIMVGVGRLAMDFPEVAEVDINPIRVGLGGALAADALVVLSAPLGKSDLGVGEKADVA